jgi:hypothetical protein
MKQNKACLIAQIFQKKWLSQGKTLEDLAKETGISQDRLKILFDGKIELEEDRDDENLKLSKALGIRVEEMVLASFQDALLYDLDMLNEDLKTLECKPNRDRNIFSKEFLTQFDPDNRLGKRFASSEDINALVQTMNFIENCENPALKQQLIELLKYRILVLVDKGLAPLYESIIEAAGLLLASFDQPDPKSIEKKINEAYDLLNLHEGALDIYEIFMNSSSVLMRIYLWLVRFSEEDPIFSNPKESKKIVNLAYPIFSYLVRVDLGLKNLGESLKEEKHQKTGAKEKRTKTRLKLV